MKQKTENEWKSYILEHMFESKKSACETTLAIQASELNAGNHNYTRTLHIPKFFTDQDRAVFEKITSTMYDIFVRTIEAYRSDEEVRKLFPFSQELEELILLPKQYPIHIPICRIDIFYNEDTKDFAFCEFNTDGTSAMNENRRINEFLQLNNVWKALKPEGEACELMDSWIDAFLKDYRDAGHADGMPAVAITDFMENAYLSELEQFQKYMARRQITAEVCDIRDLKLRDGKLVSQITGQPFDAVYRRAVTRDIMEGEDQVRDFMQAVRDDKVVLIGPFSTQIPHHKAISMALYDEKLRKYFTEEQVRFLDGHLPKTYRLTKARAEEIGRLDKNDWIIKPIDSYAAKGVFAGEDLHEDKWLEVLHDFADKDYIVQEFVKPFKTENIDLVNHDQFRKYSNLTGLYVYNGKFAGVYSRLSEDAIISTQYNEKMVPTIFLKSE